MKPFNLERALAGDPVVTVSQKSVTQIRTFETSRGTRIVGVQDDEIEDWNTDGTYMNDHTPSTLDLRMSTKKHTLWMNILPFTAIAVNRDIVFGAEGGQIAVWFKNKEDADKNVHAPNRIGGKAYPIEIEE